MKKKDLKEEAKTDDFKKMVDKAKKSGDYVEVRVMLKNFLSLDPTAKTFDNMAKYAESELDGLYVEHDGKELDEDKANWNEDLLNEEMVDVVDNFSKVRIEHLKRVVKVVNADKLKEEPKPSSTNADSANSSYTCETIKNIFSSCANDAVLSKDKEEALEEVEAVVRNAWKTCLRYKGATDKEIERIFYVANYNIGNKKSIETEKEADQYLRVLEQLTNDLKDKIGAYRKKQSKKSV